MATGWSKKNKHRLRFWMKLAGCFTCAIVNQNRGKLRKRHMKFKYIKNTPRRNFFIKLNFLNRTSIYTTFAQQDIICYLYIPSIKRSDDDGTLCKDVSCLWSKNEWNVNLSLTVDSETKDVCSLYVDVTSFHHCFVNDGLSSLKDAIVGV